MSDVEYETRIIRKVRGLKVLIPDDPKQPKVLTIVGETETGPLDVRLTQIAAQELLAILSTHPLVRGSA